jgi:hypothetical protein
VNISQRAPTRRSLPATRFDDDLHSFIIRLVLWALGEHFSSGGNIKGFLEASPEQGYRI